MSSKIFYFYLMNVGIDSSKLNVFSRRFFLIKLFLIYVIGDLDARVNSAIYLWVKVYKYDSSFLELYGISTGGIL